MAYLLMAGGGIGGLAAALGLARGGHHITVLERQSGFSELGAGIQLGPNAFHALDRLGVGDQVRERSVFIDGLVLMDGATGERINTMPLTGAYRERFANPYAVVHRTDVYQPLLDACRAMPGIELRPDSQVTGYEQDAGQVTALLADGRRLTGDLLIGADGIRSAVRAQLVGDGEPRVSGHTIYRSVIPMEQVPHDLRSNAVTLWAGPGWHFVHYPISGGRDMNMAITKDDGARETVTGRPTPREHVLAEFPDMGEVAGRLLALGEDWKCWVLCDRDPVDVWVDGRVALLGDAAHPMLQYAAQGACQALEDAVLLGSLLNCPSAELTERLTWYNAARRGRTAKCQLLSRAMGEVVYHPAGIAAKERSATISGYSATDLYDMAQWLHGARDFVHC